MMKKITEEKHLLHIHINLLQPTEYKLTCRHKSDDED